MPQKTSAINRPRMLPALPLPGRGLLLADGLRCPHCGQSVRGFDVAFALEVIPLAIRSLSETRGVQP